MLDYHATRLPTEYYHHSAHDATLSIVAPSRQEHHHKFGECTSTTNTSSNLLINIVHNDREH